MKKSGAGSSRFWDRDFNVLTSSKDNYYLPEQLTQVIDTDNYDESGTQIFTLLETLKLNAIPPRAFDKEVLKVVSNNEQFVTLENEDRQSFRINKRTDEVIITDADGDSTRLITNQDDYRDFIFELLE